MRIKQWDIEVLCRGAVQQEHTIEGHTCVEARPKEEFSVKVRYHGRAMHQVELFIDGESVSGRKCIDGTGSTTFPCAEVLFEGWQKIKDGHVVTSNFMYETSSSADGDEDAGSGLGSAAADWSRGVITLKVHAGIMQTVFACTPSASHSGRQPQQAALSERAMVKGGHSATAGRSAKKSFGSTHTWQPGETYVAAAAGDPLEEEMNLFYRDSFFLLLRGDASKVVDQVDDGPGSAESCSSVPSQGVVDARTAARRIMKAEQALKKRSRSVIDLTDD